MIKELKGYTIICDSCGADLMEGGDYCGFPEKGTVRDMAEDDGWHEEGKSHYCPKCHTFDDDDNIVIRQPIKKPE